MRGAEIAEVFIEARPDAAEHVAATKAVFARWGFQVQPRPEFPLTGGPPVDLTWAVTVVLVTPIVSFFGALGAEAGKDAYAAAKAWIKDVIEARREANGPGAIHISDSERVSVKIPAPISDEVLDALSEIDWASARDGFLVWDEERAQWRDLRDEAPRYEISD